MSVCQNAHLLTHQNGTVYQILITCINIIHLYSKQNYTKGQLISLISDLYFKNLNFKEAKAKEYTALRATEYGRSLKTRGEPQMSQAMTKMFFLAQNKTEVSGSNVECIC